MKASLIALPTGKLTQPPHGLHEGKPYGGYFAPIPAVSENAAGVKLVSLCPENAGLGIHTRKAMHLPFEPETDETLTIMQGAGISKWRTAAVLGAATRPDARHSQSLELTCRRAHISKRCAACVTS
tara:strand:- start:1783 stop:2160 length:378 start_codon:yes stop_codon:yes gene_type:complete